MFDTILIANRGEIAVRVIKTAREMGLETVAVYSDVDEKARHVLLADKAVRLGPAPPGQSYLDIDRVIAAAKETGSQAVHPGYGFLAENADFARRCLEEGLVFIGPRPEVIEALGNKTTARKIMAKGGVPVIPGMMECQDNPDRLRAEAQGIGYPLLIKAAAGGGGKGMRVVWDPAALDEACGEACSEAKNAFGDDSIYLEKFFPLSRHVEVQILADEHGNTIHLFERECSIQRRHQKIIEETPSPALTPELRKDICQAAVKAAQAAGYTNAGTVEFLVDNKGGFYFLEVNTRLQVEHPITEMITGVDLVRMQLLVAAGEELTLSQSDVTSRGHAIECRVYAEDPAAGYMPSPGLIHFHQAPSGPGLRNDCGVATGDAVPLEYDPIISKLVAFAQDRPAAIDRMVAALKNYIVMGIQTNISFMIDVLDHQAFRDGETFTNFLDEYFKDWQAGTEDLDQALVAYALDGFLPKEARPAGDAPSTSRITPWDNLGHWRL